MILGQNTSFGRAGLGKDAGREREETQLVQLIWEGPKAGASPAGPHHQSRHSTCRGPDPHLPQTRGSSLAQRLFPARFAGFCTSHELPAAPTSCRGGQQQVGQGQLTPDPPCHPLLPGQSHSSLPLYFWVDFPLHSWASFPAPRCRQHLWKGFRPGCHTGAGFYRTPQHCQQSGPTHVLD